MRIDIISITHEVNDSIFHVQYKVNGHLRPLRPTKHEIAHYLSVNNDKDRESALKLFSEIIKDIRRKSDLFTSYIEWFHRI